MDLEFAKQEIMRLYERCITETSPFHEKVDLFVIPHDVAEMVLAKTGLDVSNHLVSIDNYGIMHTLTQHSNPISEAKRGQIAVEKEDFLKMVDVILSPTNIGLLGSTYRAGKPCLFFMKKLENEIVVIKEVRKVSSTKKNKASRLMLRSLYKKKISK
jgi:phage-Barnase-EndoU-ColicinE5/D-RelE like nuclease3